MAFKTKAAAMKVCSSRKKGFRKLISQTDNPQRKKFLRESIKTVKVRKLRGKPVVYVCEGR